MMHWGMGLVGAADPGPALLRAPQRQVRFRASADQVRRHRGALAEPATGHEVWFAIPDEARAATCSRSSPQVGSFIATGTWDAPGCPDWPLSRRGLAAGGDPVLRIPGHGRHGPCDAGDQLVRQLAALARAPGDVALVPVVRVPRLAQRLRRRAHRLVHGRGRAPALGRVGPAAHRRCDDAHT